MIKAAFFDIDGTLVSLKTGIFYESTKEAIRDLRQNGILCFVATGRSKFEIVSEHLLDGMEFDGILTNNGQDAYGKDGKLIYGKPLNRDDAHAALDWAEAHHCSCWMVSETESRMNFVTERCQTTLISIHTQAPALGDLRPMLDAPIYKMVFFLTDEEMQQVLEQTPNSRMVKWCATGHDLISPDGGKQNAMLDILKRYGLSAEEAIAFGDSENDLEMLRTAGISVAMGNANAEAKAVANYITADCDEDGIRKALVHFNMIKESVG